MSDETIGVEPLMREIADGVREYLVAALARGGARDYQDADLFRSVESRCAGLPIGLTIRPFSRNSWDRKRTGSSRRTSGFPATARSSGRHRPRCRRILMPLTRWLFRYADTGDRTG